MQMSNARSGRSEPLFLLIKTDCFVAFSQPSLSSLRKLPTRDFALRLRGSANGRLTLAVKESS